MMMPTWIPEEGESVTAVVRDMFVPSSRRSALSRGTNERFHVIEVPLERTTSGGGYRVLGFRHSVFKRLCAGDVVRLFELPRVHAQISVRSGEEFLEIVEAERVGCGQ